jgi:hypothetical protein
MCAQHRLQTSFAKLLVEPPFSSGFHVNSATLFGHSRSSSGINNDLYLSIYQCTYLYSCCSQLVHRASVKRSFTSVSQSYRQSVGLLGRGVSYAKGRYLHRTIQTQNKRIQTSMPWVGFEHMISVFEWGNSFHALDGATTMIWDLRTLLYVFQCCLVIFGL